MALPLLISYRQASQRYLGEFEEARQRLERDLLFVLADLPEELKPEKQMEWLVRQTLGFSARLLRDRDFRRRREVRLRQLLPGARLLWFDDRFQIDWARSDRVAAPAAFKGLAEAIRLRVTRPPESEETRRAERSAQIRMKWFAEESALNWILGHPGAVHPVSLGPGKRGLLCWQCQEPERWSGRYEGGYVVLVEERKLPADFAAHVHLLRHGRSLSRRGIELGWVDAKHPPRSRFPAFLPRFRRRSFLRALVEEPQICFESPEDGFVAAIHHHSARLTLFALARTIGPRSRLAGQQARMQAFLLFAGLVPLGLVLFFRRQGGLALGLTWQVIGLFLFAVGTPTLATFQIGQDLVRDHLAAAERDAYQIMEGTADTVMNSYYLGLRRFEVACEGAATPRASGGADLFSLAGAGPEPLREAFRPAFPRTGATHFFLMDDSGQVLCTLSGPGREQEGKDLQPLFRTLARMKLLARGLPVRGGEDLAEQALAESLPNLEEIKRLLELEQRAFQLQFFGKTLTAYSLVRSTPDRSRSLVLVFVANAVHFERTFLEEHLTGMKRRSEESRDGLTVLAVPNQASFDEAVLQGGDPDPTTTPRPGLRFNGDQDRARRQALISAVQPTLKSGLTIRGRFAVSGQEWLLFSTRIRHFDTFSLVLLADLERLTAGARRLAWQTGGYILLYLLITVTLGWLLSRGLLDPILRLRQAVGLVGREEYSTEVILPGRDEIVDLGEAFNEMTRGLWERQKMSSFLSRSAVAAATGREPARSGGVRGSAIMLIANIRGFRTIAATQPTEQVVQLLNEYFTHMHGVIARHGGDIDKFMGDTLMAVFFASPDRASPADAARRAVRAGLEMRASLDGFNRRRRERDGPEAVALAVGFGLAAGEVIAGNIGSADRRDHTVIGETVTRALALEGESIRARHTGILADRAVVDLVGADLECAPVTLDTLRGFTRTVEAFEVLGLAGATGSDLG